MLSPYKGFVECQIGNIGRSIAGTLAPSALVSGHLDIGSMIVLRNWSYASDLSAFRNQHYSIRKEMLGNVLTAGSSRNWSFLPEETDVWPRFKMLFVLDD